MCPITNASRSKFFQIRRKHNEIQKLTEKYDFLNFFLWKANSEVNVCFATGAYVPEGLMTSCSWDYMTFTPSVRSYTMLLFTFVFFIPLSIIIFSYCCIFRAIRRTTRLVHAHTHWSVLASLLPCSLRHHTVPHTLMHMWVSDIVMCMCWCWCLVD